MKSGRASCKTVSVLATDRASDIKPPDSLPLSNRTVHHDNCIGSETSSQTKGAGRNPPPSQSSVLSPQSFVLRHFGMLFSAVNDGRGDQSLFSTPQPYFSSLGLFVVTWKFRFHTNITPIHEYDFPSANARVR